MSDCFPLNYSTLIEIDTTPNGASSTYVPVAKGVSSIDIQNNDATDQTAYLDGEGYSSTDVIGAQMTISVTGHRIYGDAAQDYVNSIVTTLGCDRKSNARITFSDGLRYSGECTITGISGPGGDAAAKQDFSYELHLNGKPTKEAAVAASALTSTVAGGSVTGTTSFTATPDAGDTLAYKLGAASFGTQYSRAYVTGYTDYTSGGDIVAAEGQYLLMLELDSNKRVVKYAEELLEAADIT
jgi:hypothetical protein